MARKYFGTDGVRGRANAGVMTPDLVMKIGMAAGQLHRRGGHRHRVVVGKDTRLSGYMLEAALEAGLSAAGVIQRPRRGATPSIGIMPPLRKHILTRKGWEPPSRLAGPVTNDSSCPHGSVCFCSSQNSGGEARNLCRPPP